MIAIVIAMLCLVSQPYGNIQEHHYYNLNTRNQLVKVVKLTGEAKFLGVTVRGYETNIVDTIMGLVISEQAKQKAEALMATGFADPSVYYLKHDYISFMYAPIIMSYFFMFLSLLYLVRGLLFIHDLKKDNKLQFLLNYVSDKYFEMRWSFIFNPWKSIYMDELNEKQKKIVNCKLIKNETDSFSLQYFNSIKKLLKRR